MGVESIEDLAAGAAVILHRERNSRTSKCCVVEGDHG